ncbi:glutaminyl-peptide cyclotransferase [Xylariales sp. PMI_506]|nr:glutaminyl-peptide cyclotransferase [Xylariales sp. PMI_506]
MHRLSAEPFVLLLILAFLVSPLHAYEQVSDNTLQKVPSAAGDFDIHTGPLLSPILIPRVPGTPGSAAAQRHFVEFFRTHLPEWRVELHNVTSKTPATGDREIPFTNLIFTRDPPWARPGDVGRLVLAAHYDSLYRPEGFIGAVDSAAPCAVLMHIARSIDAALTKKWDNMVQTGEAGEGLEEEKGVQIVLFDGEEAWVTWSAVDSLYGARALAETWDSTAYPSVSAYRTPIQAINMFVLLDLLGAADPNVPSYFPESHWAYQHLAELEARLRKLNLLQAPAQRPFFGESAKTADQFKWGYIEDDHIPFLRRGVPILHVIPMPFPSTWHTMDDNGEHLDIMTLRDWGKILTAFVAEWMELEGFMDAPKQALRGSDDDIRERSEL